MAVDTREKRASMVSWARPWMPALPVADSTVDEGARYQLAWVYRSVDEAVVQFCPETFTITDLAPTLTITDIEPTLTITDLEPSLSISDLEPSLAIIDGEPTLKIEEC